MMYQRCNDLAGNMPPVKHCLPLNRFIWLIKPKCGQRGAFKTWFKPPALLFSRCFENPLSTCPLSIDTRRVSSSGGGMRDDPASIARQLKKAARLWGTVFLQLLPLKPSSLEEIFYRETLAYALVRIELQLREAGMTDRFMANLRHHCRDSASPGQALLTGMLGFDGKSKKSTSDFNQEHFVRLYNPSSSRDLAQAFRSFCELTGLGAQTIVGEGDNLASLIFYFVIYSQALQQASIDKETGQELLRCLMECREFFDQKIALWTSSSETNSLTSGLSYGSGITVPNLPLRLPIPAKGNEAVTRHPGE